MSSPAPTSRGAPSVDDDLRELLKLLPRVMAGLKRSALPAEVRALFGETSLGPRHIPALAFLLYDGPMAVSELAARLGVTLTTASLMVSELDRHGLASRREDEHDRRRTIVAIPDTKRPVIEGWLGSRAEPMRRTLERLPPDQRRAFLHAMRLLEQELHTDPSQT